MNAKKKTLSKIACTLKHEKRPFFSFNIFTKKHKNALVGADDVLLHLAESSWLRSRPKVANKKPYVPFTCATEEKGQEMA